jgi:hypothetical protein
MRRPSEGRGVWNRAGRRSGGSRPAPLGGKGCAGRATLPIPSIQCHEGRHEDCRGTLEFAPGACECPCHRTEEQP